jgi:acetyl-CoA acetyltransferase
MTIDVGCSTGLVVLHQACRTLQSGESDISIVAAACALISPDSFISFTKAGYVYFSVHLLDTTLIDSHLVFSAPQANASLGMKEQRVMVEERV